MSWLISRWCSIFIISTSFTSGFSCWSGLPPTRSGGNLQIERDKTMHRYYYCDNLRARLHARPGSPLLESGRRYIHSHYKCVALTGTLPLPTERRRLFGRWQIIGRLMGCLQVPWILFNYDSPLRRSLFVTQKRPVRCGFRQGSRIICIWVISIFSGIGVGRRTM